MHNDLHFDNVLLVDGKMRVIDFERSIYAPKDYELGIIYRMIRRPRKFASEKVEKYVKPDQYSNIMKYIKKYYPDLINTPNLDKRLAIYDMVYFLNQLVTWPDSSELKEDVLRAARVVIVRSENVVK